MFRTLFDGLLGDVRVRVFCREPVLRITGRLIFALGGKGMANGVVDCCCVGVCVGVVEVGVFVFVDKHDVVAGTKKRLPLREGERGEEMNGALEV
jgi:hypothetical protein